MLNIHNEDTEIDLLTRWRKIAYKLIERDMYYILQYKDYNNYIKINNVDDDIINLNMSKQAFTNESYFMDYCKISKNIKVPTLVITGNEDYAIGITHHEKFKFQNQLVKTINGKHTPYIEDTNEFIEIVNNFISNL